MEERSVKSTMEINCSRPFCNTEKNDSYLDRFEPHENLNQAITFGIAICILNAPFQILLLY